MHTPTSYKHYRMLGLIGAFVLLAGAGCTQPQPTTTNSTTSSEEDVMEEQEVVVEADVEEIVMTLAGTSAKLYDYTQADYEQALQTDKLIVLYFYANWCPICKDEVANALYPFFNEYAGDDIIGFRVSFNDNETDDSEKDRAREFGVAYQHTKVLIKNGERVLKSPESWDKARYETEVAKAR